MKNVAARGKLHIGTSGWSYKHWKDIFYPADLPERKWLEFYATKFSTVEINNSFYRLPRRETFESWRASTPPDFVFAVKASRYITHIKKLKNVDAAWARFLENASGLADKLGPILFQFPANWHVNISRLESFLNILPTGYKYAFEFRHASWFHSNIYALLERKGAALCIADSPNWPSPFIITAPFVFIRMHGSRQLYSSDYTMEELSRWAKKAGDLLDRQLDIYIYFNNDAHGYAVKNAQELIELLGASNC